MSPLRLFTALEWECFTHATNAFLADITATPVGGASHSGLIGINPFAAASIILIVAFFVLLKADDPAKTRNQLKHREIVDTHY